MTDKLGPYLLGPSDTRENGIYTGDSRELAKLIPDESVDLIFTDPVYDRIEDYRWLAETAARVLKDSAALLTCFGIGYLPETIQALTHSGLQYRWTMGAFQPNGPSRRGVARGFSKWWGVLWLDKHKTSLPPYCFPDMVSSVAGTGWPGNHQWRKNPGPFISWLKAFTALEYIIFDPFTGGGTVPSCCVMLGRQYLAFEIDPETAQLARERVANTPCPLPGLQVEQSSFAVLNEHMA